ncbi:MAG: putative membrane protein [Arcticibacterium sp.]|jgi:uncharacterized membrane protein
MPKHFSEKLEKLLKSPVALIFMVFLAVALVMLKYYKLDEASPLLLTIGRFHPIILHFPLVLLALALIIEFGSFFNWLKLERSFSFYLLLAAALFTFISIVSGYLLFASGEYSGNLMDEHFNGAVLTGCLLLLTCTLFIYQPSGSPGFLIGLLITNLAAFYTGHQGGNLTHGQNYLTEYLPLIGVENETYQSDSSQYLYEDIIKPVFEAKCAGCHTTLRAKGEFSVSTYEDLLKVGESGKMPLRHYKPAESELLVRILMPDSLTDHMPPAGKTPLDENEIKLLEYWISKGAKQKQGLVDSSAADSTQNEIRLLVNQLEPALKKYRFNVFKANLNAKKLEAELEELAVDMEVDIKRDEEAEGNLYTLSAKFPPAPFGSKKLSQLKPYLDLFTKVSLVSSEIDDSDLYVIGQMSNLNELYLQKSKLKGSGLIQLSRLDNLEILNISFTEVDDKALLDLVKFPALKQVYTYSTKTTKDVIIALQKYKPTLQIHAEEGPYF